MIRLSLPRSPSGVLAVEFPAESGFSDRIHLFRAREIHAINAAMAAGRPLLVRGEPGVGKSQLARAVAKALRRAFVKHVVDAHTESRDLMWTFDAVKRLAEAQLAGAMRDNVVGARMELAMDRFLYPGPLWWAFDWQSAECQATTAGVEPPAQRDGGAWENGSVLLLDEIDKAEAEVPNGLLDALGAREFTSLGGAPVRINGTAPLVVITTNEERVLPDAFLRRCLVLHLGLPTKEDELIAFLVGRGRAHFPDLPSKLLRKAAGLLYADRAEAIRRNQRPYPGQAEYLDLLRAVRGLAGGTREGMRLLEVMREYTLRKHDAPATL